MAKEAEERIDIANKEAGVMPELTATEATQKSIAMMRAELAKNREKAISELMAKEAEERMSIANKEAEVMPELSKTEATEKDIAMMRAELAKNREKAISELMAKEAEERMNIADKEAKVMPEPYKGKGIRYASEVIARKEGKFVSDTTAATENTAAIDWAEMAKNKHIINEFLASIHRELSEINNYLDKYEERLENGQRELNQHPDPKTPLIERELAEKNLRFSIRFYQENIQKFQHEKLKLENIMRQLSSFIKALEASEPGVMTKVNAMIVKASHEKELAKAFQEKQDLLLSVLNDTEDLLLKEQSKLHELVEKKRTVAHNLTNIFASAASKAKDTSNEMDLIRSINELAVKRQEIMTSILQLYKKAETPDDSESEGMGKPERHV